MEIDRIAEVKNHNKTDKDFLKFRKDTPGYWQWRLDVFARDNVAYNQPLEAHHILPYSSKTVSPGSLIGIYDRYRTDLQNGISLSIRYHKLITKLKAQCFVKSFFVYLSHRYDTSYEGYPLPDSFEQKALPEFSDRYGYLDIIENTISLNRFV